MQNITVPQYLMVGQKTSLVCNFDLGGETLYSLTWWKDERQFYQYTSSKARPTVVFTVPGISVNVSTVEIKK